MLAYVAATSGWSSPSAARLIFRDLLYISNALSYCPCKSYTLPMLLYVVATIWVVLAERSQPDLEARLVHL